MMINRMQHLGDLIPDPTSYTDYYHIETLGGPYIVSLSTALVIERQLDTYTAADWLQFDDVFGVRHRMPAPFVFRVAECARETRAAVRAAAEAGRATPRDTRIV